MIEKDINIIRIKLIKNNNFIILIYYIFTNIYNYKDKKY